MATPLLERSSVKLNHVAESDRPNEPLWWGSANHAGRACTRGTIGSTTDSSRNRADPLTSGWPVSGMLCSLFTGLSSALRRGRCLPVMDLTQSPRWDILGKEQLTVNDLLYDKGLLLRRRELLIPPARGILHLGWPQSLSRSGEWPRTPWPPHCQGRWGQRHILTRQRREPS